MRRLASADEPIVFFLDELPLMLDRLLKSEEGTVKAIALMRWLRELRQAPDLHTLRFVLAGSIGIEQLLNQIGEISTINDFERMKLQPYTDAIAEQFLEGLSSSYNFPLNDDTRAAMLTIIGPPVPYFLQGLFSETRKACDDESLEPSVALVERVYREKVLGEDCKTYFDHYNSWFAQIEDGF